MITSSSAETQDWGAQLAASLRAGAVVALHGELGAGKTCLVKGIARGLGITAPVTSPTFTLVHEHSGGRLPLYHVDLYRLDTVAQATAIGIEDYLAGPGVTVVEWAERIEPLLPPDTIHIHLTVTAENHRAIEVQSQ